MDTAERLAVIRARLQKPAGAAPMPRGLFGVAHPEQATPARKRGPWDSRKKHGPGAFAGLILPYRTGSMVDWIYSPVTYPERYKQPIRRETHHLTKIAEKWLHAPNI